MSRVRLVASHFFTVLVLSYACLGQQSVTAPSLVLAPSSSDIERSREGFPLTEGCERLKYKVDVAYPGRSVLKLISDELRQQGWISSLGLDRRSMTSPGLARMSGRWESYKNVEGGKTRVRAEQWRNNAGDVVSYMFWYFTPDVKRLRVEAKYCKAAIVEKYQCVPHPAIPHDEKTYSVAMKIKKVEAINKDFRVFVGIENNGEKPILLGVNGKLPDGSPELWVLGAEQEDEQGEWSSVDAVCAEHPAFDWITLKQGEKAESWALAVEFPEPNHRFAKCLRKIAHLHGRIRVSIRYYTDVCEIEEPFDNNKPYYATSEPVELPLSQE
jgi:hypothetical protein